MKVAVYAVGRLKRGAETELCDRYRERIDGQGRGIAIAPVSVTELTESRNASVDGRKAEEAEELLKRIPQTAFKLILDEHGKIVSSKSFANQIKSIRDDGASELAIVIGGPDGHGPSMKSAANQTLSLSHMTLPHGLARVMILEQLYRAITILSGHPYHRS